jgi:hypothetical protein
MKSNHEIILASGAHSFYKTNLSNLSQVGSQSSHMTYFRIFHQTLHTTYICQQQHVSHIKTAACKLLLIHFGNESVLQTSVD